MQRPLPLLSPPWIIHYVYVCSTSVHNGRTNKLVSSSLCSVTLKSLCTSSWNLFGEESRYTLCLQAYIISFLLTRNQVWFFTGISVIAFRNLCRYFLQREQVLAACSWQSKDPLLFHNKSTTVTNQETSTFPVHRTQSAYLIKNSWNKALLKKSKWQTIGYLRSAPSYTAAVPSVYAIHNNPPLEYIQSRQNLFHSLTPCFFLKKFVICQSVRMCQSDLHLTYFRDV